MAKPKIFHGVVNFGGQAGYISKSLRSMGYVAHSYTYQDSYNRQTDFVIQKGKRSFIAHVLSFIEKVKIFYKYNIFHFYFGKTLFTNRIDLYFYRIFGKKVVMEYLGNDVRPYKYLISKFSLDDTHPFVTVADVHDLQVKKRIRLENRFVDFRLVCAPIYFAHAKQYGLRIDGILNLAINLPEVVKYELPTNEIVIMHAPTSRKFKGTDYFLNAVSELQRMGYPVKLSIMEFMSHSELLERIKDCHIFCDQISEGWYGTISVEAMALGKPTCAYLDEEYLDCCDFRGEIPILNVRKTNVTDVLLDMITNHSKLLETSRNSRLFVEKFHSIDTISSDIIKIYKRIWPH
jgi:hypothetical protein